MMLPKTYSTLVIADGDEETRDYTWAELHPSVFDPNADHRPLFRPLGNERGNWRLDIRWALGEWDGPRPAMITITTCDPDEEDIDVIEDHRTFIFINAARREEFNAAYALARQLVVGSRLPADCDPRSFQYVEYRGTQTIVINPSRHHVAEAA